MSLPHQARKWYEAVTIKICLDQTISWAKQPVTFIKMDQTHIFIVTATGHLRAWCGKGVYNKKIYLGQKRETFIKNKPKP